MRSPAGDGRRLRSASKRDKALADGATPSGDNPMISIERSAPRRPATCAKLALCFGLALGAIGEPADRVLAADSSTEIFDILDDNGDGAVTREEFLRTKTELFYRALKNVDQDQRLDPEDINVTPEAFAEADLNGDGKMSGAEFVQARFTQFEAIDASGDQKITLEEFREFIQQYQL
jgi:Ca2+-binding EF-hand superfamily protein